MQVNEILLVMECHKGKEKNSLVTAEDFLKYSHIRGVESKPELAKVLVEMGKTLGNPKDWLEIAFEKDIQKKVRFCANDNQLEMFLQGEFNKEKYGFDELGSSWECMKYLDVIGLSLDGGRAHMSYDYERLEEHFVEGAVVHNFNGRDYRIMEKFSEKKLLLMDVNSGAMVVGIDVGTYKRTPRYGIPEETQAITGIEWGHGVYLPSRPSLIDFRALRQQYGNHREAETLTDYREQLKEKFNLFYRVSKDELATDALKEVATNSMYEEFNTGRPDKFAENLNDGMYDRGFIPKPQKEVVR